MLVRASPNSDVTQMGKSLSEMQATWVRYLGQEDTLEKKWQPSPVLLPGKSHGPKNLTGYSTWGLNELDTSEVA